MNNINENRTDKRAPGGEKSKAELKWFILFLAVIFFLPITILAVVEWFTSADAFAIGITGFMQAANALSISSNDMSFSFMSCKNTAY